MKKNILVQVGGREEQRTRHIPAQYNEIGELIAEAYNETYTVNVPVMEARNVEMTPEEIAELERMQAQAPAPAPTAEDRLTDVENVSDMAYVNAELALALIAEMEE